MINTMMDHDIKRMIEIGKIQANSMNEKTLVSSVTAVDKIDPIAFYKLGTEKYTGSRVFWADYKRDIIFVGFGRAVAYEPVHIESRFQDIDEQWKNITEHALVSEGAPIYAGPVLLGGFNFDPIKPKSELWQHFPHTLFAVPQYMLTVTQEQTWLTINKLIEPGDVRDHSIDHELLQALHTLPSTAETLATVIHKEEIAPTQWMNDVEQVVGSIKKGELDKVVLARQMRLYADKPFIASAALEQLYTQQVDSYVFAFEQGEDCFIGATPERLIKKSADHFLSTCLAGSTARGDTDREDHDLGLTLLTDNKNLLEHDLAVQMITKAMAEVCVSINVLDHPILYKLKDIQHLYTPVAGQAKEGTSLLKGVEALHPTPALGGFPPQEAVKVIREVEQLDRGWYAAPIGWMNRYHDGEFAVAIRSALIQGKEASLFAGCGIMGDSNPISEYNETTLKFRPMLAAFGALDSDVIV